jgi:hypothetical protein
MYAIVKHDIAAASTARPLPANGGEVESSAASRALRAAARASTCGLRPLTPPAGSTTSWPGGQRSCAIDELHHGARRNPGRPCYPLAGSDLEAAAML